MTPVTGRLRGHPIEWTGGRWVYSDTGEPTEDGWRDRPCGHCGIRDTPEGHDGCLGTLPGVRNACCGHGVEGEAYVQTRTRTVRGEAALAVIDALRCRQRELDPDALRAVASRWESVPVSLVTLGVVLPRAETVGDALLALAAEMEERIEDEDEDTNVNDEGGET